MEALSTTSVKILASLYFPLISIMITSLNGVRCDSIGTAELVCGMRQPRRICPHSVSRQRQRLDTISTIPNRKKIARREPRL